MKGRTVVLRKYFEPMEIQEYDVPDPEPGAIVGKIRMAGLCGSDLHTWRGDQINRALPESGRPMGHEGVADVWGLGQGVVTDFTGVPLAEGDRIVFSAVYSCGRCQYCLEGDQNLCAQMRLSYRGAAGEHPYFVNTYSDFVYLPPGHPVYKVPAELSDKEVVSLNCAMGTVLQGVTVAGLKQGDVVVIQGAGGLGLYAAAFARDMGAARVIVIDGQKARLDLALQVGADEVIDIGELTDSADRLERIMESTAGRGADLVIELAGLGELVQEGINMLARGGTFLEIGNLMQDRGAQIFPQSLLRRKKIIGSNMYRPAIIPRILNFLSRNHNRWPLGKVISHEFSLANINDAFAESEWQGRETPVIRSVIVPEM